MVENAINYLTCHKSCANDDDCRQGRSEWLEAPGFRIDMVSLQNLLTPFGCVLGKDTLRHFPLLGSLGKQF